MEIKQSKEDFHAVEKEAGWVGDIQDLYLFGNFVLKLKVCEIYIF
jgi:hypothetical protein